MNQYETNDIIRRIAKAGGDKHICPICGKKDFFINNKKAAMFVSGSFNNFTLDEYVNTALLVCNNCGHVDVFALPVLFKQKEGE